MWLMYPILPSDIRAARRGVLALLAGSAVWYGTLALVLARWAGPILDKVRNKFDEIDATETNWTPILILLVAYTLAGASRALGYWLGKNVTGAIAHPESSDVGVLGVVLWLAAAGTVKIGFTGLIGFVAALGTAAELRFLRYPSTLFGLVVSARAQTWVARYFWARVAWLGVVIAASLVMLASHGLLDIPRHAGGPWEASILRVIASLRVVFNVLCAAALVTLPILTAGYWLILFGVYNSVHRLTDPNGPIPQPEPPKRPGFDQLKSVLMPQQW